MERAAAKPFSMLSAYFMTAATIMPPRALAGRERKDRTLSGGEAGLFVAIQVTIVYFNFVSLIVMSGVTNLLCFEKYRTQREKSPHFTRQIKVGKLFLTWRGQSR